MVRLVLWIFATSGLADLDLSLLQLIPPEIFKLAWKNWYNPINICLLRRKHSLT